jgi:hypothetical protein
LFAVLDSYQMIKMNQAAETDNTFLHLRLFWAGYYLQAALQLNVIHTYSIKSFQQMTNIKTTNKTYH